MNTIIRFVERFAVFIPVLITITTWYFIDRIVQLEERQITVIDHLSTSLGELTSTVDRLNKGFEAHLRDSQGKQESGAGEFRRRLDALESAINQSPDKALTVPLLQKDVDALRQTSNAQIQAIKDSVSANTDLVKWLMSLLIVSLIPSIVKSLRGKPGGG